MLIAPEIGTLKGTLRSNELTENMAGEFMLVLIPGELLAGKAKTVLSEDAHTAIEFPDTLLIKIISRITLDIAVDVELLVKLFEQHTLIKNPAGRHTVGIHLPSLGNDAVLDDTRITDEGIDAIRSHHRHRVSVVDSRRSMFYRILAGSQNPGNYDTYYYEIFNLIHYYI